MSNIRGLSDIERSGGGGGSWEQRRGSGDYLTTTSAGSRPHPRCIDLFFPGFRWKSFILAISIVQITIYIITVSLGSSRLVPNGDVLSKFGSSRGPLIQDGQIWRLLTPILLHGSIWHIVFNVFFQLRLGFSLERDYGIPTIAAVYLISGFGGNCFSVAWAPCKSAVGASTSGFGLIGLQLAELALSWHLLGDMKDQAIFNVAMFVVISVMLSLNPGTSIDWRGHLGGFIAGFSCGVYLGRTLEHPPPWLKRYGIPGAITALIGLFSASLLIIFLIPMTGENGRCGGWTD